MPIPCPLTGQNILRQNGRTETAALKSPVSFGLFVVASIFTQDGDNVIELITINRISAYSAYKSSQVKYRLLHGRLERIGEALDGN